MKKEGKKVEMPINYKMERSFNMGLPSKSPSKSPLNKTITFKQVIQKEQENLAEYLK